MLLDKIINTVFSFGAAVVIFGAWGKLEHKTFGDTALTAGLLTETAIFCLYGLLEWIRRPQPAARVEAAASQEYAAPQSMLGEHAATQSRPGSPVHKEDLEALTGSIKETANLLARIFRV
jgi:gliding motility-associated GldL-like protein